MYRGEENTTAGMVHNHYTFMGTLAVDTDSQEDGRGAVDNNVVLSKREPLIACNWDNFMRSFLLLGRQNLELKGLLLLL